MAAPPEKTAAQKLAAMRVGKKSFLQKMGSYVGLTTTSPSNSPTTTTGNTSATISTSKNMISSTNKRETVRKSGLLSGMDDLDIDEYDDDEEIDYGMDDLEVDHVSPSSQPQLSPNTKAAFEEERDVGKDVTVESLPSFLNNSSKSEGPGRGSSLKLSPTQSIGSSIASDQLSPLSTEVSAKQPRASIFKFLLSALAPAPTPPTPEPEEKAAPAPAPAVAEEAAYVFSSGGIEKLMRVDSSTGETANKIALIAVIEKLLPDSSVATATATFLLENTSKLAALVQRRHFSEAESFFVDLLELLESVLGPDHDMTLTFVANFTTLYTEHGKAHPDPLAYSNFLAYLLARQGRYYDAERVYLDSVDSATKGEDQALRLTAINNLAWFYLQHGNTKHALPLSRECLDKRTEILGPSHPDTLAAMNNLAALLGLSADGADIKKADELYTTCILSARTSLGLESPDFSIILNNAGVFYANVGNKSNVKPSTAYRLYREALTQR